MADKKCKKKVYDIPVLMDTEELVQITPVFQHRKKSATPFKPDESELTSAIAETSQTSVCKISDKTKKISSPNNNGKTDINYTCSAEREIGQKNSDANMHNRCEKELGENFLETFAFIQNTKYYESPGSKTTAATTAKPKQDSSTIPLHSSSSVLVNQRQKGNPLLKFFRNTPWEYSNITPDYVMGQRICALFLSVRYHLFNPNYIHERLRMLGNQFEVRILLVQVDVKDPHKTLKELTKIAILSDCTLMLAWSAEEAARYIETYKIYEKKPIDALQGQANADYMSKLSDCITSVKSVNKTNTVTLLSTFESLENIVTASQDDIALCPGFGHHKAARLYETFHQSFLVTRKRLEKMGKSDS